MVYVYEGIAKNGDIQKGKIEAQSQDDAKTKLKSSGISVYKIKESRLEAFGELGLFSVGKLPEKKIARLTRDLSIFLKSGVSIAKAIKLSKLQYRNDKQLERFLSSIETSLNEGKSFYQALELQKTINLAEFYKQSIKVAEARGFLGDILTELASFIVQKERIKTQVRSAFAYPAFIISASIIMLIFMFVVAIPKMSDVFTSLNQELPPITRIVLSVSTFIGEYITIILLTLLSSIIGLQLLYKKNHEFKQKFDFLMLKVPLFGRIIQTAELSRFLSVGSMLLRSGLPFVQALKYSSDVISNTHIKDIILDATSKVVEGQRFSVMLSRFKELDRGFVQAIYLAEESGEVKIAFENLSNLYTEENKDKIAILTSILEPVLILCVGGIIGVVVVAMLLPIFSISIG
jgi:general secretion pathway protein F/type IV pilus assembly protein PilC